MKKVETRSWIYYLHYATAQSSQFIITQYVLHALLLYKFFSYERAAQLWTQSEAKSRTWQWHLWNLTQLCPLACLAPSHHTFSTYMLF